MKRLIILLLVCVYIMSWLACQKGQAERDFVPVTTFDPHRDALKDISMAKSESKRTGKKILLNVGGDWCTWCKKLDQFFEENVELNNFLHQNFIVVKINFSPDNRNKKILSQFPTIPGYPHFFLLNKSGRLIHSQNTSELEQGAGYDRKKVQNFLNKWASRADV